MTDYRLKAKIIERYRTQGDFADAAGTSEHTVSRVVRGRRELEPDEILEWSKLLQVNPFEFFRGQAV